MTTSRKRQKKSNLSGISAGPEPSLDAETLRQYLIRFVQKDPISGRFTINGMPVYDETERRKYSRWSSKTRVTKEAGFFAVDRFLTLHGLTTEDFFAWAKSKNMRIWTTKNRSKLKHYQESFGG